MATWLARRFVSAELLVVYEGYILCTGRTCLIFISLLNELYLLLLQVTVFIQMHFPEISGTIFKCAGQLQFGGNCVTVGVHNTCHPRTDPTVIVAVLSPDKTQLLLGQNRRFTGMMYSCLAGFMEPGMPTVILQFTAFFYPHDAMLARYLSSKDVYPSVYPPVCHTPVLFLND